MASVRQGFLSIDYFYQEISDLRSWRKEELMRNPDRDLDYITGTDSALFATFDAGTLNFVRSSDHRINDLSARDQRGGAGLDDHDVGFRLVEFSAAVRDAMGDGKYVIAEVRLLGNATGWDALGPNGDAVALRESGCRGKCDGKQDQRALHCMQISYR